jgi:hypothetical protein
MKPSIAIANTSTSQVFQSDPEFNLRIGMIAIVVTGTCEGQYLTGTTPRHFKACTEKLRQYSFLHWL